MKLRYFLPAILAMLAVMVACSGSKNKDAAENNKELEKQTRLEGDSTIYGLACDGCTDSVLVLLPGDDSDPITYDIIDAMKKHQVFGMPKIGDKMAVVVNKFDKTKADIVIDIDELQGTWVYQVLPTIKHHEEEHHSTDVASIIEDSIMHSLMVPIEQGFKLNKQYTMEPIGMHFKQTSLEGEDLVEYPNVKYYKEWNILNGKLIFVEGAPDFGNGKKHAAAPLKKDTVELVYMMKDSLRLKFSDGVKAFYRKKL